jgi:hypothetical protein
LNGFLGTSASVWSDLSLVFTLLLAAAAALGGVQRRRRRFLRHCPVMAAAALLNWIPVLVVMIPAWIGVVTGKEELTTGPLGAAPVFHGVLGGIAQLLMTYTVIRMYLIKRLPPRQPIWLMRTTLGFWLLSVVGGAAVYVVTYVI